MHQLAGNIVVLFMAARNHISKSRKRFESWKIQTSEGGRAGRENAKSATDADHSEGCFAHRGGTNAGVGGPIEGVLKIYASKIFDQ